eukprot:FR737202.1.p1 GENE.FR737202.1~~FR737202.1.p1  ORF type:complete len:157 (-),score=9.17 FR737202.1:283-753(-)
MSRHDPDGPPGSILMAEAVRDERAELRATPSSTSSSNEIKIAPAETAPQVNPLFIGTWKKNKRRSQFADAHLKVLGVPWAVRIAIKSSSQTNSISVDGLLWAETIKNSVISQVQVIHLDRIVQENANPMDKSIMTQVSFIDDSTGAVITESDYPKQ